MLWCQGESDGDLDTSKSEYERFFHILWGALKQIPIEKCFLIQIGFSNHPSIDSAIQEKWDTQYKNIQNALEDIALSQSDTAIVSRAFCTMRTRGLMKDSFHYYQRGYNECGLEAGKNVAALIDAV